MPRPACCDDDDVFLEKNRIMPYKVYPTLLNRYHFARSEQMNPDAYIIFSVDDIYVALSVGSIRQIIRAVQITCLPEAPELMSGLINMGGEIIPVINTRKQFKLPQREISASDRIIIAKTPLHTIAFIVDDIKGIAEYSNSDVIPSSEIFPKMDEYIAATAEYNGNTLLIYDIDCLFPKKAIEKITSHLIGLKETS
ncbi:MAG: chemotaxis protein CheW [Desulfobacterales bacterium]|jgi:purine-binding chemotaxis protein CheW|nr:chemotaxis protein CheW [Desulfobacterales bacterium]